MADMSGQVALVTGGIRGIGLAICERLIDRGVTVAAGYFANAEAARQLRDKYADHESSPRPSIILLDLNMPKKDGREALEEIKKDPNLRNIRIIVLTTSKAEEDIYRTYNLNAASFITKPVTFAGLVDVVKTLGKYWLEIVELPGEESGG